MAGVFSYRSLAASAALAAALALLWLPGEARGACAPTSPVNNSDVTCTGTTVNQNNPNGYGTNTDTGNTITVVPGATVTGTDNGILFTTGTVVNFGTITGGTQGILALNTANVSNFGAIFGADAGIFAVSGLTLTNSGVIIAGASGIAGNGRFVVSNSGIISGGSIGISTTGGLTLTNSGVISGADVAIQSANVQNDILTLLPGSIIIGPIVLWAGADTVNFRVGNQNLTFDTLAGATVTSNVPFAVSGNRAAAVDPTPFAAAGALLTDFSRSVSSAVPVFDGQTTVIGGLMPTAFAAPEAPSRFDEAFAGIPGLLAYDGERAVFKSPTVIHADGSAIWARGFAGWRVQQQDGALLRNTNRYYGGALGGDWQVRPDLRLGAFIGAGATRASIDFNAGNTDSNLAFAGVHARYNWSASFLHFALQGGISRNDTTRNINNNLVAGGLEIATASYDGWYLAPEATFGHRFAIAHTADVQYTLTPSVQLRYLYASFDGYTESGSTANLTVGRRTVQNLEERAELKLTRTQVFTPSAMLMASVYSGVLGTQRVGGDTIDATLLGQAIPFAPPGKDNVWGGFAGAGIEIRNGRVAVFASAEYLVLSDSSSVVSGKGGVRITF